VGGNGSCRGRNRGQKQHSGQANGAEKSGISGSDANDEKDEGKIGKATRKEGIGRVRGDGQRKLLREMKAEARSNSEAKFYMYY